jgi:rhamnosyltransferase
LARLESGTHGRSEIVAGTDVCAIVITYHPDDGLRARIDSIYRQVNAVVIVDNGSTDTELRMLRDLAANRAIDLVLNFENLGVARALNIGIQRAAALKYTSVLLLDQDTRAEDYMVATLRAVQASFPDKERLAVIGSGFHDVTIRSNIPARSTVASESTATENLEQSGGGWVEVESTITSGSLLSLAAYSVVGPFREEFFIDYVDEDFCLRARRKGYQVINTRKQLMSHAIGSPTQHHLLGMKKWTTNHSPDRRYYIARNNTVMLREYGNYRSGGWALKSLRRSLRQCKRIALYENMKLEKIAAVIHGWWDGIHGKLGRRTLSGVSATSGAPRTADKSSCTRRAKNRH